MKKKKELKAASGKVNAAEDSAAHWNAGRSHCWML